MKVLELFAGTRSIGKAFERAGDRGLSLSQIGFYLHNDGKDWCASYGREGNFVCLNPDAEKTPYNNAVRYGKTPNEALQGLYDWCVENGFIND